MDAMTRLGAASRLLLLLLGMLSVLACAPKLSVVTPPTPTSYQSVLRRYARLSLEEKYYVSQCFNRTDESMREYNDQLSRLLLNDRKYKVRLRAYRERIATLDQYFTLEPSRPKDDLPMYYQYELQFICGHYHEEEIVSMPNEEGRRIIKEQMCPRLLSVDQTDELINAFCLEGKTNVLQFFSNNWVEMMPLPDWQLNHRIYQCK